MVVVVEAVAGQVVADEGEAKREGTWEREGTTTTTTTTIEQFPAHTSPWSGLLGRAIGPASTHLGPAPFSISTAAKGLLQWALCHGSSRPDTMPQHGPGPASIRGLPCTLWAAHDSYGPW